MKKISETILEFGNPIIELLPDNPTKEQFEDVMRIVVSAWNAVTLDEWNETIDSENEFLKALSPSPEEIQSMAMNLISRKRTEYSSEQRAVSSYSISEEDGEFVFHAEVSKDLK